MVFGDFFKAAQGKQKEKKKERNEPAEKSANEDSQKPKLSRRKRKRKAEASAEQSVKQSPPPFQRRQRYHKKVLLPEAIELSRKLQELSRQKKLEEALTLYWKKDNDAVRDGHHACILVDCCARCGRVNEAEKICEKLGNACNVETNTALMKAFAHAGRMKEAMDLFHRMSRASSDKRDNLPNVRTLNTLLRGCLWTATTAKDNHEKKLVGGIVSSEEAWKLFVDKVGAEFLDVSSYEYSITLLCQALRTEDATERIEEYQRVNEITFKGKATISGGSQAALEGLAVAYISLARAYALLGNMAQIWSACQRVFSATKASRTILLKPQDDEETQEPSKRQKRSQTPASGGKRAWKQTSKDNDDQQRQSSNYSYRNHRLSEIESEAKVLLKLRKNGDSGTILERTTGDLRSRLLYFGGGGSTEQGASKLRKSAYRESKTTTFSMVPIWHSFGLSQVLDQNQIPADDGIRTNSDGLLQLDRCFEDSTLPVDLEIGAGFGDWIVRQALAQKKINHVAVELRADRVAQIFARSVLSGASTRVCVVGAEATDFLGSLVAKELFSTIFANYPEPPTQSYGDSAFDLQSIVDGGEEPAHMLNSSCLVAMAACLKPRGRIVIVTDNRSYARLLSMTALRAILETSTPKNSSVVSETSIALTSSGFRKVESFSKQNKVVDLFEGQPNETIGHVSYDDAAEAGSSYFDRLWKSGTGKRSERTSRFILVLRKDN